MLSRLAVVAEVKLATYKFTGSLMPARANGVTLTCEGSQ
jgi:hypothetical protein